jgi:hypothetical protein
VRSFTVGERRARLGRRHHLAAASNGSVEDVTSGFVGLHATDPATPYLSLWARMPDFHRTDLDTALYERRSVVRHLAMRRTLWVFDVADLPAVQAAASARVATNERRKLVADVVKAGIADDGDAWLDAASRAVLAHLAEHGHTSARELRAALPQLAGDYDPAPGKTWGGAAPIAPRVLVVLGVEGRVVRGLNDGTWTTSRPRWTSATQWLGADPDPADHDSARAALVETWLRTFGPATVDDLKWWFGNTLTWVRAALLDVGAIQVDLHGTLGFALPDDLEPEPDTAPWCALLPGLDVTTMGWQHREWYLGEHRGHLFDRNGNAGPTAWCDGRVVGGWAHDADGRVVVQLLEDVGARASKALMRKAAELTEWLGGTPVAARFPSPLSKSASV